MDTSRHRGGMTSGSWMLFVSPLNEHVLITVSFRSYIIPANVYTCLAHLHRASRRPTIDPVTGRLIAIET